MFACLYRKSENKQEQPRADKEKQEGTVSPIELMLNQIYTPDRELRVKLTTKS